MNTALVCQSPDISSMYYARLLIFRAGVDTVTAMKTWGLKSERMHRRDNSLNEHDQTTAAGKLTTHLIAASNR